MGMPMRHKWSHTALYSVRELGLCSYRKWFLNSPSWPPNPYSAIFLWIGNLEGPQKVFPWFPSYKELKYNTIYSLGFPGDSTIKNLPANAEDVHVFPGSGRSSGGGNGNPLQCSCLKNSMDRGAWQATVHGLQRVGHDWATNTVLKDTNTGLSLGHATRPAHFLQRSPWTKASPHALKLCWWQRPGGVPTLHRWFQQSSWPSFTKIASGSVYIHLSTTWLTWPLGVRPGHGCLEPPR